MRCQRLQLAGAPPDAGDHFGRRVQGGTDQGAGAGADPVDRIAEHGAGRTPRSLPDQRVEDPARAASSASIRIPHDREYCGVQRSPRGTTWSYAAGR